MNWFGLLAFMLGVPLMFSVAYVLLLGFGHLWVRWLYRNRVKVPDRVPDEWVAEYREQSGDR